MKRFYVFPILLLFASTIGLSQTREQITKLTTHNNTKELVEIKERVAQEFEEMKRKAFRENIPMTIVDDNGKQGLLYSFDPDGSPVYVTNYNVDAAISTRTNFLHPEGGLGLNLEGNNMTVHVWEVYNSKLSHQEFDGAGGNDRVEQIDDFIMLDNHSTHVIGTILAAGINPEAKGMAPKAKVKAYTALNDKFEAAAAAMQGMFISNHSYGRGTSFPFPIPPSELFGKYNENAQTWDEICYNAPYYLPVKSAGNDGNRDALNTDPLNGNSAYDKLLDEANSKNNLVIASFGDALVDSSGNLTSSVERSPFSNEGPTDDLRIKPDLGGNGFGLTSSFASTDTAYGVFSGTSMSAPNVTGSLLLLQEHYQNTTGNFMRAATLKGLALHTADDIFIEGPDAETGWGLLNSKKAAEAITNSGTITLVEEIDFYNTQSLTITVEASGLEDLKASISWTDVPGTAIVGLNNPTPVLVNDLDIRISQNGTTYEPYKLLSETTNGKGDNDRDPFERVDVENASGIYTITVTHKGTLVNDNQPFSLIISGIEGVVSPAEISAVDITEFPYYQSFENGFDRWTQSYDDNLNWILGSGPTPTEGTGPLAASDGEFYAFVESTVDNGYPYLTAHLNSPRFVVDDTENVNITFSYHTYGTGYQGKLELQYKIFDNFWIPIWFNTSDAENNWQTVTVDLKNWLHFSESLELRFTRSLGNSHVADFAIDDIVVNVGAAATPEPEGYCDIVFTPEEGDTNDYEWISRFRIFGGIINDSSGPLENGYSDFTAGFGDKIETLLPNEFKRFQIQPQWLDETFEENYAVYIDYNRDGDFDDDDELVFYESFTDSNNIIGEFIAPDSIGYGRSRMRVIMHWDVIEGPCGPFQYGEVEDYSVVLMGDKNQQHDYPYYKNAEVTVSQPASGIQMYPNPVTDNILNVRVLENNATQYVIYNSLGQVLDQGQYTEQINVSRLAKGMYFLELHTPDQKFIERFIKK